MVCRIFCLLLMMLFTITGLAYAGEAELTATYPYSLDNKASNETYGAGTRPLYINIENYNNTEPEKARIEVYLPAGLSVEHNPVWQSQETATGLVLSKKIELPANYGQIFDLLYLRSGSALTAEEHEITVKVFTDAWEKEKNIKFTHHEDNNDTDIEKSVERTKSLDDKKYNWYIQSLTLPVDSYGKKDDRTQEATIYIRDTTFEGFRNRMTGDGTTNWAAVFNHPAAHVLLEMRNPQLDTRVLKFKAELINKSTGEVMPGLCKAGESDNEAGQGWSGAVDHQYASTALISLDGIKNQTFILPLYADQFKIAEGEYNLRVTVDGSGQSKIHETPVTIVKQRSIGLFAIGFSILCFVLLIVNFTRFKKCILNIGAKGAITVSLFAAIAFGGIVLPSTILNDFLHVFMGPFAGLVTGLLNGVFLYLLVMALLVLYRKPGVIGLMFLLKWLLACLIFGRFTPIGVLSYSVYIVVLEIVLSLCYFYKKPILTPKYVFFVSVVIGCTDAFITLINMEQMMFFYRLYYADWYIFLYMVVNGLLYSSIGSFLGYRIGCKLQQVMGE